MARDSPSPPRRRNGEHDDRDRRPRCERDDDRERDSRARPRDRDGRRRDDEDSYRRRDREYGREKDRDINMERGRDREEGKDPDVKRRNAGPGGRYNRDRDHGVREPDRERERDRGDHRNKDQERYRERDRERERPRSRDRSSKDRSRPDPSRRSASPAPRPSRARPPGRSPAHLPPRSPSAAASNKEKDKAQPNFAQSGLLAAATNTVRAADGTSTVLKYNEPPEARKPPLGWRLYVFKGDEQVEMLHVHRQSAYLFGRDRLVADIPVEHPSCSKQHAVIQHRAVIEKNEYGEAKTVIKPFIIDLESTNGTHVNDEQIPTSRFYELKAGDVIKFGLSTREYVLLHDSV